MNLAAGGIAEAVVLDCMLRIRSVAKDVKHLIGKLLAIVRNRATI